MSAIAPTAAPQSVTALDNFAESPTTALYRAAIGPINSDYYLPIFKRFEAADRTGPCWNWAACLYTLNWMAFRRLWGAALIYAVVIVSVAILVLVLGTWLFQLSETSEVLLWLALGVLSFVIPGFYGNAWFHAASRKKMASALAASKTMQEATAQLNRQASSKQYFVGLALANLALTGLIGGAYLLFQQATSPSIKAATTAAPRNVTVGQVQVPALAADTAAASASAAPASATALTAALAPASGSVAAASATVSASEPTPTRSVALASMPASAKTPATTPASAPVAPAVKDLARSDASKNTAQTQTMTESVNARPVVARFVPRRPLVPPVDLPAAAPLEVPPKTPTLASSAAAPTKSVTASQATAPKLKQKSSAAEKAGDEKNFYVNVGLFAQEQNAHQTHTKLVSAGLPAEVKELNMTNGTRIRVRVGPFASESKANAAAKKVRQLKLDAIVTQL
jgi:cell division septation protein DedD